MIPHHSPCFIVIVHHGSAQSTTQLVDDLLKNSRVPDHIIVVDHGHPSPPLELPQGHDKVTIIRPQDNQGYGAGIMLALGALLKESQCPGQDLVLCLNNDVTIQSNTIQKLVDWWSQQAPNSIAGIRVGYVDLITGRALLTKTPPHFSLPYLHGAALASSLANIASNLPTDYFLYSEDVALSWRAVRRGFRLQQLPAILGLVHDDTPSPTSDQKLYYLVRNGARVLEQEAPSPWKNYWQLLNPTRRLYHSLLGHKTIARALKDART